MLSYALWQSQFGGDPAAVGKDIRIDGQPFTVVGVMPKGFYFLNPEVMLWRPLAFTPQQKSDDQRHSNSFQNIAPPQARRERSQRAQQQIDAINARNLDLFPAAEAAAHQRRLPHHRRSAAGHAGPRDQGDALSDVGRRAVRAADRLRERREPRARAIARPAEGARDAPRARRRKWRVARQLVTESVLLTLVSAAAGLLVGYGALQLLGTLNIQELPRGEEIRLDGVVVAYTLAVAAVIGFVLGLIPVANVLPANLTIVLREEGRSGTAGRGARTLRRALVVAQVGFAFVLLIGAGLLFASFRQVLAVQPGFNADGVLTAVDQPAARALRRRHGADRLHARGAASGCARCRASPPSARPTRFRSAATTATA